MSESTLLGFSSFGCVFVPVQKMRVEVQDRDGNHYTITVNGQVKKEKVIQLFDLIELLSGVSNSDSEWNLNASNLSKFERVQLVIKTYFTSLWFSAKEIQSVYKQEFNDPIPLSTISTYLSRMVSRSILEKKKQQNILKYRAITDITRFLTPSR